jgi:hypothetical protein
MELLACPLFFKPLINLKNFPLNSFIPTRQKRFTSLGKNIFDNHNFKIKNLISKKQKLSTSTPKKSSMAVATNYDSTDDSDNEMEVDYFEDVDEIDQNLCG